jgi:hypothetical protein
VAESSASPDRERAPGEQRLLAKASSGELVDLSDLTDDDRLISADLIRRLCVGAEAAGVDPRGLRVKAARIVGELDLSFCRVPHPLRFEDTTFTEVPTLSHSRVVAIVFLACTLPGLTAVGTRVEQFLSLAHSDITGQVELPEALIEGALDCSGATLANEGGVALAADTVKVGGNVSLEKLNTIGAVSIPRAKIGGTFDCSGATLANKGGFALELTLAEIASSAFLDAVNAIGAVDLGGAKIGGQVNCAGATLANEGGNSLKLTGTETGADVFLCDGFSAAGEVRLSGAKIRGDLVCDGATFANEGGCALNLQSAEVEGSVLLRHAFSAAGEVRLAGAKIRGQFNCNGATLASPFAAHPDLAALNLGSAEIDGALVFRNARVIGGVNLFQAAAASLEDDIGRGDDGLGSWAGAYPLVLEGFTYARLGDVTYARFGSGATSEPRLRWLRHTTHFQVGAWQQLISVYRDQGRDDEATNAAVAMHNDRLARAGLPAHRGAGRWILRLTVGHGYRPWLAGVWALAIVAAYALIVWLSTDRFAAERQDITGSPQPVVYAADTFLPIVDLGEAGRWMPTDWTRWAEWVVILLGWALSTIFVAGFTRIVRS